MKTRIYKSVRRFAFGGALFLLSCLVGCEDFIDFDDLGNFRHKPYSNLQDGTTTDIRLTIPRIEKSRMKSTEITVYLSVTDQDGNPLTAFNEYNFVIKQVCKGSTDTTLIGSKSFSMMDKKGKNVAVAATMDYSGSMSDSDIRNMKIALSQFVNQKNPDDYFEIIKFSDDCDVIQEFTPDVNLLQAAINGSYPDGRTAFYDAVYTGLIDCQKFVGSNPGFLPAVIAFTDGKENNSWTSFNEILTLAQKSQIPIYTIGYGAVDQFKMEQMAAGTGGRYTYTPEAVELQDIYTTVSGQLKNIYQVTWPFNDPGCEEVEVVVETSYTCLNGTFKAWAVKSFFPN